MKKYIVIIVFIIVVILVFPIKIKSSNGGDVSYVSLTYEYTIVNRIEIGEYGKPSRKTKGIIIRLFGIEVYNNVSIVNE